MDSDEKRTGAGSGGGPASHNDVRFVDGSFARTADQVTLFAFPGETDASQNSLELKAGGQNGFVGVYGTAQVIIRTGRQSVDSGFEPPTPDQSQVPEDLSLGTGIVLYAPGQDPIRIRRGSDDNVQEIVLTQDGNIYVSPGLNGNFYLNACHGSIHLNAGTDSSISIEPTGITIKAPLVQIN